MLAATPADLVVGLSLFCALGSVVLARLCSFFRGFRTFFRWPARGGLTTNVAALARRRMVLLFAAAGTALFAAVCFFVHGRPRAALRLFMRHTTFLVTFFDMLRLSFLLFCIA